MTASMKGGARFLVLAVMACTASCWRDRDSSIAESGRLSPYLNSSLAQPQLQVVFGQWMANHSRSYGTTQQEAAGYSLFVQNLGLVAAVNANTSSPYWATANKFLDMGFADFSQTRLGAAPPSSQPAAGQQLSGVPPSSVDWVASGKVSPIKDQGECGACWAFSATGALESKYLIQRNASWSLSEQQLVDCVPAAGYSTKGCNGGWVTDAFQYIWQHNLTTDARYPYTALDGTCSQAKILAGALQGDVVNFQASPTYTQTSLRSATDLKRAVAIAPTVVALYANNLLQQYGGGVFPASSCDSSAPNHMALVVGYSEADGYWKLKNSWGSDWGEAGYFRMEITADGTTGTCSMYSYGGYLPSNVSDQTPTTKAATEVTTLDYAGASSGALQGPRMAGARLLLTVLGLMLGAGFGGLL